MQELQHHGVKGMKWGVRHTPGQLGIRGNHPKSTSEILKERKERKHKERADVLTSNTLGKSKVGQAVVKAHKIVKDSTRTPDERREKERKESKERFKNELGKTKVGRAAAKTQKIFKDVTRTTEEQWKKREQEREQRVNDFLDKIDKKIKVSVLSKKKTR